MILGWHNPYVKVTTMSNAFGMEKSIGKGHENVK